MISGDEDIELIMNISSVGTIITVTYDPAYSTMNWKATETQSGIVVETSYCYLRVYVNNVRQLRMEWYA